MGNKKLTVESVFPPTTPPLLKANIDRALEVIDSKIKTALELKGFVFHTRSDLASFIKERCYCEVSEQSKERIYYVDGKPFFLFTPHHEACFTNGQESSISFNLGQYRYL